MMRDPAQTSIPTEAKNEIPRMASTPTSPSQGSRSHTSAPRRSGRAHCRHRSSRGQHAHHDCAPGRVRLLVASSVAKRVGQAVETAIPLRRSSFGNGAESAGKGQPRTTRPVTSRSRSRSRASCGRSRRSRTRASGRAKHSDTGPIADGCSAGVWARIRLDCLDSGHAGPAHQTHRPDLAHGSRFADAACRHQPRPLRRPHASVGSAGHLIAGAPQQRAGAPLPQPAGPCATAVGVDAEFGVRGGDQPGPPRIG